MPMIVSITYVLARWTVRMMIGTYGDMEKTSTNRTSQAWKHVNRLGPITRMCHGPRLYGFRRPFSGSLLLLGCLSRIDCPL